jgi:hypothetical protein
MGKTNIKEGLACHIYLYETQVPFLRVLHTTNDFEH